MTDADHEHFNQSAQSLLMYRARRAQARQRVRDDLDAMAAEAHRYLGAAFTANDSITGFPLALVVRSDERLADDYESQTPRPATDTVSRLIVDVLGHALTIEVTDAGRVGATGDTPGVALDGVTALRVAGSGRDVVTYLVGTAAKGKEPGETPFLRVLAALIDSAVQDEARFAPTAEVAVAP